MSTVSAARCTFVPPYLLARLADADVGSRAQASRFARCLVVDDVLRRRRAATVPGDRPPASAVAQPPWTVHSADGGTDLPGRVARRAGDPATGDAAVDEAATGVDGALALFAEVYGRRSYDDRGAPVVVTVHYGDRYANAFWDGSQLVFGDGDGEVFTRFTVPVDVLGHELTHAVVEHSAGLVYEGQPGALNESVSDVFAACLKQRLLGQDAAEGDWLVGEGIFLPGVRGRALRDMAEPGTAYDDPRLGSDPQPRHMDDFVVTTDDNGGVHINSGICNRAFVLAARAIGGSSAEGAGRIWYAALTGGRVGPRTDFAGFAAATVAAAGEHADAVREAWAEVGVGAAAPGPSPGTPPRPAGRTVRVVRSGGFAGLRTEGVLDLDTDPAGPEVAAALDGVDLAALTTAPGGPDRYVYEIEVQGGSRVRVPEQQLTPDLRRAVETVLGSRRP